MVVVVVALRLDCKSISIKMLACDFSCSIHSHNISRKREYRMGWRRSRSSMHYILVPLPTTTTTASLLQSNRWRENILLYDRVKQDEEFQKLSHTLIHAHSLLA